MISYSQYAYDNRVQRYAMSLQERGDQVDVICLGGDGKPAIERKGQITLYHIQERDFHERSVLTYLKNLVVFFIRSTVVCTRLHQEYRYRVIHFHNIPDFGVFCTIIPKMMGAKVILDIHDLVPEFYMQKFGVDAQHPVIRFLKWIEKISARYADHVITVTDIWRQRLISRSISAEKVTVVLNAPYTPYFSNTCASHKTQNGKVTLSYHGNLGETTGVEILVRSMKKVTQTCPNVQLWITGKGREDEKLKALSRELGLEESITFREPVPNHRICETVGQADIGIDPKLNGVYSGETLSVKAMEYLAMGIPLIVSRTKAAEMYFDDTMVQFFRPDDADDLARQIIELCRSVEKRKSQVVQAERFLEIHSWDRYKEKYYSIVDGL